MHDVATDLRFAARLLWKSPGLTVVVLLTLTLGIGANTTMFSLLDALVFRDLPVPQPQQLVHFGVTAANGTYNALSMPMFQEISKRQSAFSSTFAWWGDAVMNVEACNSLVRADIYAVSGNYYSELGAVPESGRLIGPQDTAFDRDPAQVAVLGRGFLDRNCGGNHDVVDQIVKIDGVPFRVIGIVSGAFSGLSREMSPEVTVPITAEPIVNGHTDWRKQLGRRSALWLDAAGRLRAGVSIEQARAQLETVWPSVRDELIAQSDSPQERDSLQRMRIEVNSIAKGESIVRGRFRRPVWVLLGISGLLLLLACVNLAGLMLARAIARRHELAVRLALGASRSRVARQVLTESLLLSFLGTAMGFIFAMWAGRAISDFVLGAIYIVPASLRLTPDARLVAFTGLVAVMSGALFGLAPAWSAMREDPNTALQQGARSLARGAGMLGRSLVVAQISLSLVLVAGAGLLIRSLQNLRSVQPGFRTAGVLNFDLFPQPGGYKAFSEPTRASEAVAYYRELTDRVSNLPGVASAGLVHDRFGNLVEGIEKVRPHGSVTEPLTADGELAMPGLFRTMEIKLLEGRDFSWADDDRSPHVAIVSAKLAKQLFPGRDSIGLHVDVPFPEKEEDVEIVGVVSDASLYDIRKPAPPTIYLASTQYKNYTGYSELMVRTSSPSAQVTDSVRAVVNSMGHEYVPFIATVTQELDRSILQERVTGILSEFLAALALLLAAVGLYGLLAYHVTLRTREIGIRVALGAQRGEVRAMILRETFRLLMLGAAIGLPFALAATRLIAHMLFGLSAHDPATIAATMAALAAAGLLAAILPAWRAMRVDPIIALRCE